MVVCHGLVGGATVVFNDVESRISRMYLIDLILYTWHTNLRERTAIFVRV